MNILDLGKISRAVENGAKKLDAAIDKAVTTVTPHLAQVEGNLATLDAGLRKVFCDAYEKAQRFMADYAATHAPDQPATAPAPTATAATAPSSPSAYARSTDEPSHTTGPARSVANEVRSFISGARESIGSSRAAGTISSIARSIGSACSSVSAAIAAELNYWKISVQSIFEPSTKPQYEPVYSSSSPRSFRGRRLGFEGLEGRVVMDAGAVGMLTGAAALPPEPVQQAAYVSTATPAANASVAAPGVMGSSSVDPGSYSTTFSGSDAWSNGTTASMSFQSNSPHSLSASSVDQAFGEMSATENLSDTDFGVPFQTADGHGLLISDVQGAPDVTFFTPNSGSPQVDIPGAHHASVTDYLMAEYALPNNVDHVSDVNSAWITRENLQGQNPDHRYRFDMELSAVDTSGQPIDFHATTYEGPEATDTSSTTPAFPVDPVNTDVGQRFDNVDGHGLLVSNVDGAPDVTFFTPNQGAPTIDIPGEYSGDMTEYLRGESVLPAGIEKVTDVTYAQITREDLAGQNPDHRYRFEMTLTGIDANGCEVQFCATTYEQPEPCITPEPAPEPPCPTPPPVCETTCDYGLLNPSGAILGHELPPPSNHATADELRQAGWPDWLIGKVTDQNGQINLNLVDQVYQIDEIRNADGAVIAEKVLVAALRPSEGVDTSLWISTGNGAPQLLLEYLNVHGIELNIEKNCDEIGIRATDLHSLDPSRFGYKLTPDGGAYLFFGGRTSAEVLKCGEDWKECGNWRDFCAVALLPAPKETHNYYFNSSSTTNVTNNYFESSTVSGGSVGVSANMGGGGGSGLSSCCAPTNAAIEGDAERLDAADKELGLEKEAKGEGEAGECAEDLAHPPAAPAPYTPPLQPTDPQTPPSVPQNLEQLPPPQTSTTSSAEYERAVDELSRRSDIEGGIATWTAANAGIAALYRAAANTPEAKDRGKKKNDGWIPI